MGRLGKWEKKYGKHDTIQPDNLLKSEFCIHQEMGIKINADHQPTM